MSRTLEGILIHEAVELFEATFLRCRQIGFTPATCEKIAHALVLKVFGVRPADIRADLEEWHATQPDGAGSRPRNRTETALEHERN